MNILKRNKWLQARDFAAGSSYRFHAIEPLPNFADKEKAREILETLANDRGILAVMATHKYVVVRCYMYTYMMSQLRAVLDSYFFYLLYTCAWCR